MIDVIVSGTSIIVLRIEPPPVGAWAAYLDSATSLVFRSRPTRDE
jgi:hypothetical protein